MPFVIKFTLKPEYRDIQIKKVLGYNTEIKEPGEDKEFDKIIDTKFPVIWESLNSSIEKLHTVLYARGVTYNKLRIFSDFSFAIETDYSVTLKLLEELKKELKTMDVHSSKDYLPKGLNLLYTPKDQDNQENES